MGCQDPVPASWHRLHCRPNLKICIPILAAPSFFLSPETSELRPLLARTSLPLHHCPFHHHGHLETSSESKAG